MRPSAAAAAPAPASTAPPAVHTHMTNSRLTDPEVLEWRYPVLLESHRINRGSGGQGRHKGGDGTIRRVRFLEPMQAALVSNRREVPPFGLHGGSPGIRGDQWIERADGRPRSWRGVAGRRWGRGTCSPCRRRAAEDTGSRRSDNIASRKGQLHGRAGSADLPLDRRVPRLGGAAGRALLVRRRRAAIDVRRYCQFRPRSHERGTTYRQCPGWPAHLIDEAVAWMGL